MKIEFSFEPEFDLLLDRLQAKYGKEMFIEDGLADKLDVIKFTDEFVDRGIGESTIDVNANVRVTNVSTYFSEVSKPHTYLYSLYKIWQKLRDKFGKEVADEFVEAQINGAIYLHDRHHAALMPYCFAYTLQPIVERGLPFIETIKSDPAKHLSTFIQHVIQFVMFASNQSSGAVGLPDFFVWMWYFVKKDLEEGIIPRDKLDWYIEQHFQILTYSLNQPIRTTQSPYTNFTYLDRNYIKAIFEGERYPDGSLITDHVEDIIALQKHYWEWVSRERERQMFTFPVLTASLLYKDGKFLDEDSASFIARVNMKWQDTNWYISDSIDAVASCCRLTSSTQTLKSFSLSLDDAPQLRGMMNSIGGSDLNIGSFKVVTINLPRIALESNGDRKRFIDILKHRVELVQKTLVAVREIIKDRIKQNLLPLYKHNLMLLDRQYGTIGITGVWEAATLMGLTVEDVDGLKYTPEGEAFVDEVLDTIRELAERNSRVYGFTFNIEQVPAEKAAVTLANKDRLLYGEKQPFVMYSNQWVPLFANADVLNRIAYSGRWDRKVSGGAILHINLGEPFGSVDEYFNMVKMIADMGVVYFAFNTKISVCEEGHAFYGERCPVCGKAKKDEYTRIVGYLVPISSFNKTRREYEYPKRVFYSLKEPVSI